MIKKPLIEKSLLASILLNPVSDARTGLALEAIGSLSEEHFTTIAHREIFSAIRQMVSRGFSVTETLIGEFTKVDVEKDILQMLSSATSDNIRPYIDTLKTCYKATRVLMFSRSVQERLVSDTDTKGAVDFAESEMMDIMLSDQSKISDEGYMRDYLPEYFRRKEEQMKSKEVDGVPTGIPRLDTVLGGLGNSDTIVVAGRTGMGKSSFIATMIAHQLMHGYKPAVFSLELGRMEIVDKAISILSEMDADTDTIPFRAINNPAGHFGNTGMNSGNLQSMQKISQKYLQDSYMYIRGTSRITVEEIMSKCRKLKAEGNLDILYIDHIGLLVQDKSNERAELTHITNSLRLFAGEMKIPVVEVVQLNRGADTTSEKPRKSHLKGSGSIEEDASTILMPWRPSAINPELPQEQSEVIVAKGRNAGEGNIQTHFSTITTRFTEMDENHISQEEGPF